jgi:hypothetical protein
VRIVAAIVLLLAVASVLSFPSIGPARSTTDPVLRAWVPTPDGSDGYAIDRARGALTVRADPGNVGGNLRAVIWPEDAPVVADATECVTWTSAVELHCAGGVALRVASLPRGSLTAITVAKNIYYGASWWFNVHLWRGQGLGRQVGQFDLRRAVADPAPGRAVRPLPWRLCARTRGARLEMLVWPLADPAPRWGDPRHGGTMALPAGTAPRGVAGWYVGHLGPDMSVTYTELHGALPQEADTGRVAIGPGGGVALTG